MNEAIQNDNPVIFMENKRLYATKGEVPEEHYTIPFGQAQVKREGRDLTVVGTHEAVLKALSAAETLAREGIEVEVVDPLTLVPLDKETILASVRKTGRLIVADEGHKTCGVAAEISALAAEEAIEYLKAPVVRICSPDTPVPFSPPLEKTFIPAEEAFLEAGRRLMEYSG
jgi:pyruvate dehydrogenase E1 component beta subunit